MSYGLIYQTQFDGFNSVTNKIEIYKKDYSGSVTDIVCGAGAASISYGPDEPKAPIKGCEFEAEILNITGSFPLSNFYSNEDDTFKIIFYVAANIKFVGFLVADNCEEIEVDYTHGLKISATDNLGLLKDVPLNGSDKTLILKSSQTGLSVTFTAPNIITSAGMVGYWQAGDILTVVGSGAGTYNVLEQLAPDSVRIAETIASAGYTTGIDVYRNELQGRYTLAQILNIALTPTALELGTKFYSLVYPVGGSTERLLEDTYIDAFTFSGRDKYDDCWKVIEKICTSFKLTLMQVGGYWVFASFNEVLENGGTLYGYEYDSDMVYVSDISATPAQTIGNGSDIETGLISSLLRPYKRVVETFDYKEPDEILRNASFAKLGPMLAEYADGTDTVREYVMADWQQGFDFTTGGNGYIGSTAQRFIRVVTDSFGLEKERYGVIKGNSGFSDWACAQSYPIEVRKDDKIEYSFDLKTKESQVGWRYFIVEIITTASPTPRSFNNKRINPDGHWFSWLDPIPPGGPLQIYIPPGDNLNVWHSVSVTSDPIPVDGLLTVKLAQCVLGTSSTKETHYKNIRMNITRGISGSNTITGQEHKQQQTPAIRNEDTSEIDIDDSPSSVISGTLMLESFTGPLRDLTTLWRDGITANKYRLGELVTRREIFSRFVQRNKLEGTILRSDFTPIDIITYTPFSNKRFIFGKLKLIFKEGLAECTLWEQYEIDEVPGDLPQDYNFRYLYNTK